MVPKTKAAISNSTPTSQSKPETFDNNYDSSLWT